MGANDMDHMQHVESVALSDCAVLQSKEATYQGSWKRAGGRSAWFMARRNLDRMITMAEYVPLGVPQERINTVSGDVTINLAELQRTLRSEDIFALIAAKPGGEDGSFLACMRDARRYFTLVEAEMIAEGICQPESQTYEQEHVYLAPETDVYQMIADEKGLDRETVKERVHWLFYGKDHKMPPLEINNGPQPMEYTTPKATVTINVRNADQGNTPNAYRFPNALDVRVLFGDTIEVTLSTGEFDATFLAGMQSDAPPSPAPREFRTTPVTEDEINAVQGVREFNPHDQPVIVDGLVHQAGVPPRKATAEDYRLAGGGHYASERAAAVADGGSQHAEQNPLWPWQATKDEFDALFRKHGTLMDLFYTVRAVGLYQLDPVVGSRVAPKELANVFQFAGDNMWVIRRDKVPAELEDNFPRLRLELNTKEWEGINEDHQFMYWQDTSDLKWKIKPEFANWGRD